MSVYRGSRRLLISPEPCRWTIKLPAECTVECRFRGVAYVQSDRRNTFLARLQDFGTKSQSPSRQIGHRRFTNEMPEALDKSCPRYTDHPCQARDRPRMCGIFVHMC